MKKLRKTRKREIRCRKNRPRLRVTLEKKKKGERRKKKTRYALKFWETTEIKWKENVYFYHVSSKGCFSSGPTLEGIRAEGHNAQLRTALCFFCFDLFCFFCFFCLHLFFFLPRLLRTALPFLPKSASRGLLARGAKTQKPNRNQFLFLTFLLLRQKKGGGAVEGRKKKRSKSCAAWLTSRPVCGPLSTQLSIISRPAQIRETKSSVRCRQTPPFLSETNKRTNQLEQEKRSVGRSEAKQQLFWQTLLAWDDGEAVRVDWTTPC